MYMKMELPLTRNVRKTLKAGETVLLSGTVYTARDAAHKRLIELMHRNKKMPFSLKDSVIYYAGPAPAPPGKPIGSCGPTTSSRMDEFTPPLLKKGLGGMIGKGGRSGDVRRAIKKSDAVYFIATGGAAALLSKKVKSSRCVCFKDLGPEAVYELKIKDFPVIVAIDSKGRSIHAFRRKRK